MSNSLRKAIMIRSKCKTKYNKNRTEENWSNHEKQRNFYVNLLRKAKKKKQCFNNLKIGNDEKKSYFFK